MQATVSAFDDRTGSGAVLSDDGVERAFDPHVFVASGLRTIRLGQRVGLEIDAAGAVRSLWLVTMPPDGGNRHPT